jgi:hypothetical protein
MRSRAGEKEKEKVASRVDLTLARGFFFSYTERKSEFSTESEMQVFEGGKANGEHMANKKRLKWGVRRAQTHPRIELNNFYRLHKARSRSQDKRRRSFLSGPRCGYLARLRPMITKLQSERVTKMKIAERPIIEPKLKFAKKGNAREGEAGQNIDWEIMSAEREKNFHCSS